VGFRDRIGLVEGPLDEQCQLGLMVGPSLINYFKAVVCKICARIAQLSNLVVPSFFPEAFIRVWRGAFGLRDRPST